MRVLDLFSGLGGWSKSFLNLGHEVMRIENNPLLSEVENTQIMCVKDFRDELRLALDSGHQPIRPDIILASPPCTEFSNAYSSPKSIHVRENGLESYEPDMSLLEATIDIIKMLNPRYWVIENVVGSIRYFEEYLGKPKQIIGPFVLWGVFPHIHLFEQLPSKAEKDKRHSPLRSNYKAEIPLPLSMALLTAILEQTSLFDFV